MGSSACAGPWYGSPANWRRANVAIAVTDQARDRMGEVRRACARLGFEVAGALPEIGVLLGSVDLGNLGVLRDIPGVLAVAIERPLREQRF